jgi:hypothetical protein
MPSGKPEDETVLQSLCPNREVRKGSYCNKRTRIRTSTIMISAAITTLPSWNALRRSYLKLLLFLLRPMDFLALLPGGRRGLLEAPPISVQEGVWG